RPPAEEAIMRNGSVAVGGVWVALAGVGLLGVGAARAQDIPDRKTLEAEAAKVDRLRGAGKPAEALPIAQRVAEAAENLFGGEATETGFYLNELGLVYQDLGQYAKAEPL